MAFQPGSSRPPWCASSATGIPSSRSETGRSGLRVWLWRGQLDAQGGSATPGRALLATRCKPSAAPYKLRRTCRLSGSAPPFGRGAGAPARSARPGGGSSAVPYRGPVAFAAWPAPAIGRVCLQAGPDHTFWGSSSRAAPARQAVCAGDMRKRSARRGIYDASKPKALVPTGGTGAEPPGLGSTNRVAASPVLIR
jgi:hypothetical protein